MDSLQSQVLPKRSRFSASARANVLGTLFAVMYLCVAVAAVWHAPHFSQVRASVGVDRHAGHEAVFGDECALCSLKTAPQLSSPSAPSAGILPAFRPAESRTAVPTPTARLLTAQPRGPPSPLS